MVKGTKKKKERKKRGEKGVDYVVRGYVKNAFL